MILTADVLAALLNFAVKFGIDAAIGLIKRIGSNPTIDDAIAALDIAASRTLDDYKKAAPAPNPPLTPTP